MFRRMWLRNPNDYISKPREESEAQYFVHKRMTFLIGKNNSGKSRFIRMLFENKAYPNNKILETIDIPLLDTLLNNANSVSRPQNSYSPINMSNLVIGEYFKSGFPYLINHRNLELNRNNDISTDSLIPEINSLGSINSPVVANILREIKQKIVEEIDVFTTKKINNAFYIPILRGMRPVKNKEEEDATPYIKRTITDYFSSSTLERSINKNNIITGECLFYELTKSLLGEPEERERVRKYEELLSQYFFDNQQISLIPKYKEDVVYIKIGEDKQHPIYQLGDGLQQVIILTYECFIHNNNIHAFFIEEPELHMHPGMLRQLMNFYLNETKHFYFFTTHSNHLLDMADESDEVVIQKFNKIKKDHDFIFEIKRCDKDRELLSSLGVRPSSVYLANCTIWVEGITDRLYLSKFLQKYLEELEASSNESERQLFIEYRRFMPNYHYTFVEYQGSNLVHWNFDKENQDQTNTRGLNAKVVCSDMLLIADGDINKGTRVADLTKELNERFILLKCKEIENTLPSDLILRAAQIKFSGMNSKTTEGFDISLLSNPENHIDFYKSSGIGKILDNKIRIKGQLASKRALSEASGTIKDKLTFCRLLLSLMDSEQWELTESAKELCEIIFKHIQERNS